VKNRTQKQTLQHARTLPLWEGAKYLEQAEVRKLKWQAINKRAEKELKAKQDLIKLLAKRELAKRQLGISQPLAPGRPQGVKNH
jgi:hypothetical protein